MKNTNLYLEKKDCCGCGMCANVCPSQIIQMIEDQEGFLYPEIIDYNKCLNCKLCLKVCPLKDEYCRASEFIDFYAGSYKSDKTTVSCSSGGLATAIEVSFIKNGGIVYGAAYSSDYKRNEYIRVDRVDDIEYLKSSKYTQADKNDIYKKLEIDLKAGIRRLFTGLPCDVLAVKKYFSKYNEYLYTIELVCHGPTSNKVQKEYCEMIEKKSGSSVCAFTTRYKKKGNWKPYYIKACTKNGDLFKEPYLESSYGSAFRYLKRYSCYECTIKDSKLAGDLMIGDYHYVEKGMKGYNRCGVSSAMSHNEKGNELIRLVGDDFNLIRIPKRNALANGAIHHPISAPEGYRKYREVFVNKGIFVAHELPFVRKSNFKRKINAFVMKYGLKIKRLIFPGSRPVD